MPLKRPLQPLSRRGLNDYVSQLAMCVICGRVDYQRDMIKNRSGQWVHPDTCYDEPHIVRKGRNAV